MEPEPQAQISLSHADCLNMGPGGYSNVGDMPEGAHSHSQLIRVIPASSLVFLNISVGQRAFVPGGKQLFFGLQLTSTFSDSA